MGVLDGLWAHIDQLEPSAPITVGVVLFVIPEPATSTAGIALLLPGIVR